MKTKPEKKFETIQKIEMRNFLLLDGWMEGQSNCCTGLLSAALKY
jgi:hypothetical protein